MEFACLPGQADGDGRLPALCIKNCAPRSSIPIKAYGSEAIIWRIRPSVPKPPGKPSHADIFEPIGSFYRLLLFELASKIERKPRTGFPLAAVFPFTVVVRRSIWLPK
jgi:hypothetical protein